MIFDIFAYILTIVIGLPITLFMIISDPTWGCNVCIDAMEYLSHTTGLSYELINVLLFVILGPLTTILFGTSTILALCNKKKPAIIIGSIAVVIVVFVVGVCAFSLLWMPDNIIGFTDIEYIN